MTCSDRHGNETDGDDDSSSLRISPQLSRIGTPRADSNINTDMLAEAHALHQSFSSSAMMMRRRFPSQRHAPLHLVLPYHQQQQQQQLHNTRSGDPLWLSSRVPSRSRSDSVLQVIESVLQLVSDDDDDDPDDVLLPPPVFGSTNNNNNDHDDVSPSRSPPSRRATWPPPSGGRNHQSTKTKNKHDDRPLQ